MTSWSQAKFEFCTNGVAIEEGGESHSEESGKDVRPLEGISKITEMSQKNKNIGYLVDHKQIATGKFFSGIVLVPQGMPPGDCFDRLELVFNSKSDITGIGKSAVIERYGTQMTKKYEGNNAYKLKSVVEECKNRIVNVAEVMWWDLLEVEEMSKTLKEECKKKQKSLVKQSKELTKEKTVTSPPVTKKIPATAITAATVTEQKELSSGIKDKPDEIKQVHLKDKSDEIEVHFVEKLEGDQSDPGKQQKIKDDLHEAKVTIKKKEERIEDLQNNLKEIKEGAEDISKEQHKIKEDLKEAKKIIKNKDSQIESLNNELTEMQEEIKSEAKGVKKVLEEKDVQIKLLGGEMLELESKIKLLQKTVSDLTREKMDWSQNLDEEENINKLENDLEETNNKLELVTEERNNLLLKVKNANDELAQLKQSNLQLQSISKNVSYLQTQLVTQKSEMEEEIKLVKSELVTSNEEIGKMRDELREKEEEVAKLRQQIVEAKIAAEKVPSSDVNMAKILAFIEARKSPKIVETSSRIKPVVRNNNEDIQVARVKSKQVKILLVGNPQIFRNMENITSIRNNMSDLMKLNMMDVITLDFEGFDMNNLVTEANNYMKAAKDESTKEAPIVFIFPGNHYVAKTYVDENQNKDKFVLMTKMKSAVDDLVSNTVDLLSSVAGKSKEIVVVLDPVSDVTYEFSRKYVENLAKITNDWISSLTMKDPPKITVWDSVEDQMKTGLYQSDKRNCFEIVDDGKSLWLDKNALTTDGARVSKRATIDTFNKMVDKAVDSPAASPVCDTCGIQQSSSYIEKCVDNDMGPYRVCAACQRDGHGVATCYSMKFQSDRLCKHKVCARKGLMHNVQVHDIVTKQYQDEATKALQQNIMFWPSVRLKRPFFSPNRTAEPPNKKKKL